MRRVAAGILAVLGVGVSPVAQAATVKASSELVDDDKVRHGAGYAFDGLLGTAWAEEEMGVGEGAWLQVSFDRPTDVAWVSIWPGDLSNGERALKEHGRPRTVTLEFDVGSGEPLTYEVRLQDGASAGMVRSDTQVEVAGARSMKLRIDEAYAGYIRNDTYIAEVAINLLGGSTPNLDRVTTWVESASGQKAADKHRDEVIALFDRIDQSEFGDRDALRTLMDWAANGAPYLVDKVRKEVPYGFRVGALPPDPVAVEALLKIKDANAIPAIELAALRSTGSDQRKLQAAVSYFEAWSELKTGGRRSIATWGVPGFEKGALRSFGEPMGVGIGLYGDLYIADVANHRISVFDQEGRVRATWGHGDPTVTNVWFSGTRPYYASGREPSTLAGGFTNPLDVLVIRGKETDEIWTLDALGRVQRLDDQGTVQAAWQMKVEMPVVSGVGGSGHLVMTARGLVVILGNEAGVYDRDGNELDHWSIEDGAPVTAAAMKNGRLALGFTKGAAEYGIDGFRFKTLLTGEELPLGYEAWSLEVDEKGKLWVVTDHGYALKFKKPGKVEFQVQWVTYGVTSPRFTVDQDMLYVVADGKIHVVDALELKAVAELGDAAGQD